MKKICLIGQFPPPIHGLSKALETIVQSNYLKSKYELNCVDIKDNKRFISNLKKIERTDADMYYFTISQTKFGNLRDMIILWRLLKKGKKVVIHYHGGYYKELYNSLNFIQKSINKNLISQIDIMIALSHGLKKIFEDVIDYKKIRVCENYVEDSSLISNEEFNLKIKRMHEEKRKLEVIYLSNFIKTKGYYDVLQAANQLKGKDVQFNFAGGFFSEQEKEEFFNYIQKNNLQDIVTYHGVVKGEQKKELLLDADIFSLPTYYPKEGQPISIIEAMGNGLPIITTKHAGIPDIVKQENGYLINPESPNEISEAVNDLLNNREKLMEFAQENRKYALKEFKEMDYIKRLEKIFDEVLEHEN
ncbi:MULTISPECIES: glycosyltransferase family 4 protein [Bacillus cereus group]|uniref:glycosyltransferase family 4 protein n=1 Tax=Bacillus cereus group TaxID=86661 RepID=UPI0018F6182E|nr:MULTISPECIES: glycosyltransferase family 4 protein [Bacillus cereus group]MBJ8095544.1 glycosyltransferase family 4 protein [Bacillus cereus]MCQ6360005.1 glycosyltransferase family 4 protein [Bacillus cereus]CAH2464466.1 Glycosyl transferases group 1 [Bacillus mycoides KBAB4]